MKPLVVVNAGTPWDGVAGSDRMLGAALTAHADLLWVDPPASAISPGARRLRPRIGSPAPGVTRLTPTALPLHSRAGLRNTTPRLVRAQIEWVLRRLGRRPRAVLDCRLGRMLSGWEPGVLRVLYGTDDYVAGAALMGRRVRQVRAEEARSVADADLVVAVSTALEERWRAMGARTLLLPNGVAPVGDLDATAPAADVDLPRPVAGVIGHLSARIDAALLEAVVAGGCSLLLVGPVDRRWAPRIERLCVHPRVASVGPRPHAALPGYLRRIDVGLTPYADSAFNRAAFPLKTLEYLAAGRPVVSTDLPATRWLATDLVRVAKDPEQFARYARELGTTDSPELVAARRAFAGHHGWPARAATLATAIGLEDGP